MEFYEQACAVDSDTQRCAGSTAECRRAVLGILGTQLRNLCVCKGSDPREIYTCLDWQRILWYNPCQLFHPTYRSSHSPSLHSYPTQFSYSNVFHDHNAKYQSSPGLVYICGCTALRTLTTLIKLPMNNPRKSLFKLFFFLLVGMSKNMRSK